MDEQSDVIDSPTGWVNKHIRSYVETDGEKGHQWQGKPTLLLTMVGRKSGLHRRTALIYGQDGADGDYVVVASNGGSAKNPAWYLNLVDNPDVEVQVGAEKFAARAIVACGEERERLWQLMAEMWPTYNSFQKKTKREIPVIVLRRKTGD